MFVGSWVDLEMRFKIEKIFIKDLTTLLLTLVLFPVFSGAQELLVVKNLTVIKEKNRFAGWPANHGIWSWGNEIVIGFSFGFLLLVGGMAMGQPARRASICFPVRIKCSANSENSYRLGEQAFQRSSTISKSLHTCTH